MAVGALGSKAQTYTTNDLESAGWTQVSSIAATSDNYYIFVDANSSAYVMSNDASHYRPCYKTIADPVANPSFVWILEGSDNTFALKSYSTGSYFIQADGWNTSMTGAIGSTTFTFALNDGKYSLTANGRNDFVGHWNDNGAAVASDGENIAANKAASNAPGFYIYSIAKTTYDAALIVARQTEASSASESTPYDATAWIQNANWSGDWGGWARSGSWGNQQWGQQTLESWNATDVVVKQELSGVPNGKYRVTADLISGPGATKAAYVFGTGSSKVSSSTVSAEASASNYNTMSSEVEGNTLTADNIVVTNNTLTIGIDQSTGWIVADNFKLYYYGEDLSIYVDAYNEAVTAAEAIDQSAPMFGAALSALQSALSNYGIGVDTTDKDALLEATSALGNATTNANTSIAAYAKATSAIADAEALQTKHNFVTTAAATTFAEAIAAIKTPYEAGTLSNDEASVAATTLGVVAVGWHAAHSNENFTAAEAYMQSAWTGSEYNDWSIEGVTDGSNFLVPFFQNWTADANSLTESTTSGQLTGLENGLYSVSAWVRVRAKNGTTATDATGITINVNGGEAVDVTEGTQIGTSQFQLENYTAQGLVKDGTLNLNFVIAADNNISWLSFKNISYTKVRDLTEEEAAIVPTAIAMSETATIFKGNTLTLTPTFTPEDATQTVTWTSDNEAVATVANGVVTAVGYGTANITVTSTLDAEVSAICAVTVTAPLITEAANLDFAEGPVATTNVVTYDKDKGTGKAQMQEVTGWTIVANGDARAAAVFEYNSGLGLGSATNTVPTTGPEGTNGYTLGIEAVWSTTSQYTQNVLAPAGCYTITLPVYNQAGTTAVTKNLIGFIEDNGTEHLAATTSYAVGSWTNESISFNLDSETYGKLSLGYTFGNAGNAGAPHLFIDCMEISYEPFATAEDYAALNTAIENAETEAATKTLGFQKDEYAPYVNAAAITALAAAKAIDQDANNAQSAVQAATTALTSATWTANTEEVNAIYDGTFAAATNNGAPAGWRMSNNTLGGDYHARAFVGDERLSEFNETNSGMYLRFDGTYSNRGSMYYYGDTEGYTMPLKADTYYRVTVDFAGWGSTGKPLRLNVTGPEGFEAVNQQYTTEVRADNADSAPQQFNILFKTDAAGNYVINFQTPGDDTNTHTVVISNLKLFTEPETEVTMTVKAGKYGTFIAPFDVDIPTGVTASKVTAVESDILTLETVDNTIPANTPVVLYNSNEDKVEKTFSGVNASSETSYKVGLLTGVYTEATIAGSANNYVLQTQGDKQAFYAVESDFTATPYRAYLTYSATGGSAKARALYFEGEDATAIATIAALTQGEVEAIYTLGGAKIQSLQKGINIVKLMNGEVKKVFVK